MLVVSNDSVNELYRTVQVVEIADGGGRETLVTVRLTQPKEGIAKVAGVGPLRKEWFTEYLGTVDNDVMEHVEVALRAVYDL